MNLKPLLLALLFSPLVAIADVSTAVSTTAPMDAYLSNILGTSSSIQWKNQNVTDGPRDVGQTFKLTESVALSGITFQVKQNRDGSYDSEFRLSIFAFADESAFAPNGVALYQETGRLPSVAFSDKQYLTFTLSQPLTLGPGQYGIQLSLLNSKSRNDVNFYTGSATNYPDGIGFLYDASGPDSSFVYSAIGGSSGADLNFFLHAKAIPEPTTLSLGLLLLAGGAAWTLRGRSSIL